MNHKPPHNTCQQCGATSSGKFCHACGAPTPEPSCPKCEAALSPGARFCHACGVPTKPQRSSRGSTRLPWAIAGSVIALSIVLIVVRGGPPGQVTPGSGPANGPVMEAPDISNMTLLEQADGLFEIVMTALEHGDSDQVAFFAPMALGAYRNLDSLDADAKYHVGLLRGAIGDHQGMVAMADSLQAVVPGHLLATTLRKAAGEARGDSAAIFRAYRQFLKDYAAEATTNRPEYRLRQRTLDSFLEEARRATTGSQISKSGAGTN